jgi:5'-3' exonuclease
LEGQEVTLLIVDVSYLCYRAFHTTRELSWGKKPTGVIFGFLKSITQFKDQFQTDRIAFCFEHPRLFRKDIFPEYKARRHKQERTEEEQAAHVALIQQIAQLRKSYLSRIGFKNIFCVEGYESDDIMAAIAANLPRCEDAILITADQDLYQCLRPNVSIFSPQSNKLITFGSFQTNYGIHPRCWAVMKALAGCNSDGVPGITGIGEKTALKYLRNELKPESMAYQMITSATGANIVRRNKALVKLPYEGCPVPMIVEDEVDERGWRSVCTELGMRSIAGRAPVATRKSIYG